MAAYVTDITQEKSSGFITSAANNLAVIHCNVQKTAGYFSTVIIQFSLEAKWQITYKGKTLTLDKISVQTGYESDSGDVAYKNSAPAVNVNNAVLPMIWTKDNTNNIYKATYVASKSLILHVSYAVAFNLTSNLPADLQNLFTGKQDVSIDPVNPSLDYSIKISLT